MRLTTKNKEQRGNTCFLQISSSLYSAMANASTQPDAQATRQIVQPTEEEEIKKEKGTVSKRDDAMRTEEDRDEDGDGGERRRRKRRRFRSLAYVYMITKPVYESRK
ncbi:uncharacterized protein A4U43_C08F16770 [Asparagus officinalis]|nr:uncharacterized protein A4U43_C08F16770 [Asparagus officinalis]